MLGLVVSGRLVQTNPQQVGENKYLFVIEDAVNVQHIVVFLLGTVPLPTGFAAGVYMGYPGKDFQFLGYIANDKPSAVFKISNTAANTSIVNGTAEIDMSAPQTLHIGISIETMQVIEQQIALKEANQA